MCQEAAGLSGERGEQRPWIVVLIQPYAQDSMTLVLVLAWGPAPGSAPARVGQDGLGHSTSMDARYLGDVHYRQEDYRFLKLQEDARVYRGQGNGLAVRNWWKLRVVTSLQHVPDAFSLYERPGQPS